MRRLIESLVVDADHSTRVVNSARFQLARGLYRHGPDEEARELLSQIFNTSRLGSAIHPQSLKRLGRIEASSGTWRKVAELYRAAILSIDSDEDISLTMWCSLDPLRRLAKALDKSGDHAGADEACLERSAHAGGWTRVWREDAKIHL
jgi:hypothetical protein